MSLVTRRMRKHAYQLERRATDFPRKFCRATQFPSDRISCDTGDKHIFRICARARVVSRMNGAARIYGSRVRPTHLLSLAPPTHFLLAYARMRSVDSNNNNNNFNDIVEAR